MPAPSSRNKRKIGLALGSGSARGWAHIGVIKALEEANIPIHCVAGTSIGAFVGAVYVTGSIANLEKFALQMDWKAVLSYFDVVFPRRGLLDGSRIYHLISQHTATINVEDARIPFCCIATDLGTGEEVRFYQGNLVDAVRASVSFPGIFTPFVKDGHYLADGGLVNPVPVNVAREMGADVVLAVDLNHAIVGKIVRSKDPGASLKKQPSKQNVTPEIQNRNRIAQVLENKYMNIGASVRQKINEWMSEEPAPNIFDVLGNAINIMEYKLTQTNLEMYKPEFLIQPDLGQIRFFDFTQAEFAIREGYAKTGEIIAQLKDLMNDDNA